MKMLSTKEVSEYLKMGINQTRNLIKTPDFPKIIVGKKWLVPADELDLWIKHNLGRKIIV